MNHDRPVQLPQKVEFLHEKIDLLHKQVRTSALFDLKMKFIEYIDTSIEKICTLDNKNQYSSEVVKRKYEEYYKAQDNQKERERIEQGKHLLATRIAHLSEKQRSIQIQSLRIEIENGRIVKEKMSHEYAGKELQLKNYLYEVEKKLKSVEKELEKVIKMNSAQAKEIQMLKQERKKAEKRQMEWKQKYDNEIGILETLDNRKGKYTFRNDDGLRIYRTISNSTNVVKGCERLVICDLPLKFHVAKLVYGIKVGQMLPTREIQYFKEISLYEKEEMLLSFVEGQLRLEYIKRKVILRLDKYEVNKSQVIIMLFGKGDSIAINQTQ